MKNMRVILQNACRLRLLKQGMFIRPCGTKTDESLVLEERHAEGSVCRLVLNSPKKRNALSLQMLTELRDKLDKCDRDGVTRAIILAAKPPIFSAGHDLRELLSDKGLTYHAKVFSKCTEMMQLVQDIAVPVVAEVKGVAAAAGCQLIATADIVVAADNSKFSTPGGKVAGLFCSTPGVALARAVPRKVAMDMLLTGDEIDAQAALRAGLVSRIVPEDQVESEAMQVAEKIASLSKPVIAMGKLYFYLQLQMDRNTAYKQAERMMIENIKLKDCQEGIQSFIEKRPPKWTHSIDKVH